MICLCKLYWIEALPYTSVSLSIAWERGIKCIFYFLLIIAIDCIRSSCLLMHNIKSPWVYSCEILSLFFQTAPSSDIQEAQILSLILTDYVCMSLGFTLLTNHDMTLIDLSSVTPLLLLWSTTVAHVRTQGLLAPLYSQQSSNQLPPDNRLNPLDISKQPCWCLWELTSVQGSDYKCSSDLTWNCALVLQILIHRKLPNLMGDKVIIFRPLGVSEHSSTLRPQH